MLLLQRGGGYNAQQKAKMPSSLPFYTLTIFVLMSPGLWEGCGLAHSVQGSAGAFLLETVTGAPHQKRMNEGLHWTQLRGPFPVPHAHTTPFAAPRWGIQASASGPSSVHVPITLRAALGMQRSSAYTGWNSEPQTQWDSLWLKAILIVKTRIYGHTLPGSHCKQTKCERPFSRKLEKLGRAWVSSITCLW